MSLHRFIEVRDGVVHAMPLSLARPGTRFTPSMDYVLRPTALAAMSALVRLCDVTTPECSGSTSTV